MPPLRPSPGMHTHPHRTTHTHPYHPRTMLPPPPPPAARSPHTMPPPVPMAPPPYSVLAPLLTTAGYPATIPPPPPVSMAPSPCPVLAPLPTTVGYPAPIPPPPPSTNSVSPDLFDHIVNRAVDRAVEHSVDEIWNLFNGRLEGEHGKVHLTSTQHRMLSKLSPSQWNNGDEPIDMERLDFAGRLCFTIHGGDILASKLAANILRVIQDVAGTIKEESSFHWNHSIVLLLNKGAEVEIDGKSYSGILTGAASVKNPEESPWSFGIYKVQLSKSTLLTLDMRNLGCDNLRIRELGDAACGTEDNEKLEEKTDC